MSGAGTVLVTGAAGRIGRTACAGVSAVGWRVLGTDLRELPDGVPGVRADLTDPAAEPVLVRLLDGADAVLHLAAIPGEDRWELLSGRGERGPDWWGDGEPALVGGSYWVREPLR